MTGSLLEHQNGLATRLLELEQILSKLDFAGLSQQAAALRERLAEGRLRLAVVGQFKRGKSTLLNALLHEEVLPTGVLPLTAIPTTIHYGSERHVRVRLEGADTLEARGDRDDVHRLLRRCVSEQENPRNRLRVQAVEVAHPAALLACGIEIIDTPGIGSTLDHNTQAARAVLPMCDVALVVLSPDPPITKAEVQFLCAVRSAASHVIFVLNKADLLPMSERPALLSFVRRVLRDEAGFTGEECLFVVSAKSALAATTGEPREASGIQGLESHVRDFLQTDKLTALLAAISAKAVRLIDEASFSLELEHKAATLPAEDLERRIGRFEHQLESLDREGPYLRDRIQGDRDRLFEAIDRLTAEFVDPATKDLSRYVEGLGHAGSEEIRALAMETTRVFQHAAASLAKCIGELGSKKWTPSTYDLRSGGVGWNGYRDRSIRKSSGSKPCGWCESRN